MLKSVDPHLLLELATAYFAADQFTQSKTTLETLIEKNPDFKSHEGHLLYARSLEKSGSSDRLQGMKFWQRHTRESALWHVVKAAWPDRRGRQMVYRIIARAQRASPPVTIKIRKSSGSRLPVRKNRKVVF